MFREQLKSKKFTNNADVDVVADLYEKTATHVLGTTTKISLDGVPMREGDGARLGQALTLCHNIEVLSWPGAGTMPAAEVRAMLDVSMPKLEKLYLSGNALGEAGGVALAEALGKGSVPQLKELHLRDNALCEAAKKALDEAKGKMNSEMKLDWVY